MVNDQWSSFETTLIMITGVLEGNQSIYVHLYCITIMTDTTLLYNTKRYLCVGRHVEGIWHTAIVVFGREYFFGPSGIQSARPVSIFKRKPRCLERGENLSREKLKMMLLENASLPPKM